MVGMLNWREKLVGTVSIVLTVAGVEFLLRYLTTGSFF